MNQYDPIRKNLRAFSVPVDKEKLWANTSHAIPKKRKRRGVFFWLLGAAILAGSGIAYTALAPSTSNVTENAIKTPLLEAKPTLSSNVTTNKNNLTPSISPETKSSIATLQTNKSLTNKNLVSSSTLQPTSIAEANSPTPRNSRKSNATAHETSMEVAQQEIEIINDDPSNSQITAYNSKDHLESPAESPLAVSSADTPRLPSTIEPTETAEISTLSIEALDILSRELPMSNPVKVPQTKKNKFTLSMTQGYGWSSMDMSANSAELEPVITEWQGKIKSLENIETNIEAAIRLPKGIRLGAGLQYSILTSQLDYQQTISEDITEEGIIAVVIDENDNQQNLYGDVHVNRQTIIQSTRFTTHKRLNLVGIVSAPVLRCYRFETGIWLKAGYNLFYKSEGTTFSPDGEPLAFSAEESPYTLPSPFTFAAGIGTLYRINTHWMLIAKAGYEPLRYTHGLYNDQIEFHHSIFSLSVGAGYTF